MVGQIYHTELQLNKMNASDTEAPFLNLDLSIANRVVTSTIYGKRKIYFLTSYFFLFLIEMSLVPLTMVNTFCNLFVLREYILTLMTLTAETNG